MHKQMPIMYTYAEFYQTNLLSIVPWDRMGVVRVVVLPSTYGDEDSFPHRLKRDDSVCTL